MSTLQRGNKIYVIGFFKGVAAQDLFHVKLSRNLCCVFAPLIFQMMHLLHTAIPNNRGVYQNRNWQNGQLGPKTFQKLNQTTLCCLLILANTTSAFKKQLIIYFSTYSQRISLVYNVFAVFFFVFVCFLRHIMKSIFQKNDFDANTSIKKIYPNPSTDLLVR